MVHPLTPRGNPIEFLSPITPHPNHQPGPGRMDVKDGNGNPLADGDSVQVVRDPKVEGLVLRTGFLEKA